MTKNFRQIIFSGIWFLAKLFVLLNLSALQKMYAKFNLKKFNQANLNQLIELVRSFKFKLISLFVYVQANFLSLHFLETANCGIVNKRDKPNVNKCKWRN